MKRRLEVVTGFLGAGKSSFINSLIALTIIPNDKILVIQLESGVTFIDNCSRVKTITFNNDLSELSSFILETTYEFNPSRVIIEFNGTLSLESLRENLNKKELNKEFYSGANYFLCDGTTIDSYLLNMGGILTPFIASANIITVTNTLAISHKDLGPSLKKLKTLNQKAFILCVDSSCELYTALLKSNLFNRGLISKKLYFLSKYFKRDVV
ncbi:hypothetical protein KPL39_08585 [Clostridium gasigenes]|uniref:CobW/HypB/UreG, nucleotide-binding domain n=1 Tax=Clostridium gasigenes TaxID=94869 RepID=A0A7X0SAB1_9CLOT|nr:GTP-binding protein [Clostridium gasigenes]MBB6713961.1 hypothetical protein [Clostridium gasigenes]MBU3109028.1 hypothetical protein [Clostridium gasigenes]MBU3136328.1 hypothetical protein [Clostridium gasigenes]